MEAVGTVSSERSVVRSVQEILKCKGPAGGSRQVGLKHSRRNTQERPLSRGLRTVLELAGLPSPENVRVMTAGVTINGRAWRKGDYALLKPDAGGGACVCMVSSFHVLPAAEQCVFARVYKEEIVNEVCDGMFELRVVKRHSPKNAVYVDLDTITSKVYRCKHWDEDALWVGFEIFPTV
jgi:hypothetical protein